MANDGQAELKGDGPDKLPRRLSSTLVMTLVVGVLFGLVTTVLYCIQVESAWRVLASSAMFGAASLAVGGLLGLLFGVPRTVGGEQAQISAREVTGVSAPSSTVGANTNLEQISDWLTKIIVGVGLTQLGSIVDGASALFSAMAPVLGGPPAGTAFAGGVVIYFSVLGFFAGWLYARLRLGLAMSTADALLDFSRRAHHAGDPETARAAKEAASLAISSLGPTVTPTEPAVSDVETLAARYEQIRATTPSGPRRTAQLEDLVRNARLLSQSGLFTIQDLRSTFRLGTEGRRIIVLALMEGDIRLADFECVLDAIKASLSAFEQYHGLYVANLMVSSLTEQEQDQLMEAIKSATVRQKIGDDKDRLELQEQIRKRLSTLSQGPPPAA